MIRSKIQIVSTNKFLFMLRVLLLFFCFFFFFTESIIPLQNNIILRESFFYQLGQSPKILRPKPHGLERTDSQTIGDFATRRKGMYFSTACWMGLWEFIL